MAAKFDDALAPEDEARRRFLVAALSSGLFVGGLGWQVPAEAGLFGRRPRKLPAGASFFDIRGRVQVNDRPATRGTVVRAGDRVQVDGRGRAVFAVGDNAYLLRENSLLDLDGSDLLVDAMRLVTGALLGVFGRRRDRAPLRLATPTATIGIRGTGVYTEARPGRTYVCTCYGTTDIASAEQPGLSESITAEHHDAPRWVLGGESKPQILPAPFIHHTDLELSTLEALVGRDVPFGIREMRYRGPRRSY